jgi:hypothetical protein
MKRQRITSPYAAYGRLSASAEIIQLKDLARMAAPFRVVGSRSGNWSASLDDPASLKQADDQHDHRKDQQDVNETTERIRRDQTQQPQDQQNYKDCPKHIPVLPSSNSPSGPFHGKSESKELPCCDNESIQLKHRDFTHALHAGRERKVDVDRRSFG